MSDPDITELMSLLTVTCAMTCCECDATQTVPGDCWHQRYDGDPINGWHIAQRFVGDAVVYLPFCPDHQAAVVAYEAAITNWQHAFSEAKRKAGEVFIEANPRPEPEWLEEES